MKAFPLVLLAVASLTSGPAYAYKWQGMRKAKIEDRRQSFTRYEPGGQAEGELRVTIKGIIVLTYNTAANMGNDRLNCPAAQKYFLTLSLLSNSFSKADGLDLIVKANPYLILPAKEPGTTACSLDAAVREVAASEQKLSYFYQGEDRAITRLVEQIEEDEEFESCEEHRERMLGYLRPFHPALENLRKVVAEYKRDLEAQRAPLGEANACPAETSETK